LKIASSEAVSEVVGALMVLMVIVSVAGILYTMSMPVISSGQDNIKFRNAFFDLFELREKIERVKSGLEPKSVHRIQLYDYSAEFKNEPVIKIGDKSYTVASVRVIGNGWTLTYENGAIIESGRNERMLSAPNINYNDGKLYLPITILKGNFSAGGRGELSMFLSLNNSYLLTGNGSIVFYSKNLKAWKDFFDSRGINCTVNGNGIEIQNVDYYAVVYEVSLNG